MTWSRESLCLSCLIGSLASDLHVRAAPPNTKKVSDRCCEMTRAAITINMINKSKTLMVYNVNLVSEFRLTCH